MICVMNTNRQKGNWLLDFLLFIGFLVSFFLDLTGLPLHQWIGVIGGALIAWHLILHWNWVKAITCRFFGKTCGQARVYYLLDVILTAGFLLILVSGLVISTWLNLPLTNYLDWKAFHVAASLTTLAVLVLKIVLHWRWILRTASQPLFLPSRPPLKPSPAAAGMSRRDFLKLVGIVGAASLLAAYSAVNDNRAAQAVSPTGTPPSPTPTQGPNASLNKNAAQATYSDAAPTAVWPEATSTLPPTSTPAAAPTESIPGCIVRCSNHCSYPGSCRRYQDTNFNNLCDLGECL